MKCLFLVLLVASSFFGPSVLAAAAEDEIVGVWHTADNKSQVQIFKAGDRYCGRIISLKEPNWPAGDELGMGGKAKNDRRNPDLGLRNRPIVGLQLMSDFALAGKERWDSGKIYDPESGKTYKCKLALTNPKRLEVWGYVGISLLGRTEIWTR